MTDADLFPFLAVFKTLTKVFPFRGDESETRDIGRAYFKTLRKFPLDAVKLGADNCMATTEKFPKPAEWIKHIPRRMPGPELSILTKTEELEWRDAERRGYEGDCCHCSECRAVGAYTLKTRFVPNDPEERALMGDRQVLRGHWIHGDDLNRWYTAKADFWTMFDRTADGMRMPGNALFTSNTHTALVEREPGEDG